jgi:cytochrome d ubiquinol oxidase subunit I
VGDIFGAPLAIEGIMAFFMESTFIAIMFFGWNKVSKKAHLTATWLTAIGSNLSGLWILVANAWMQNPVGMEFNPDTARNEMHNFLDVLFNPVAMNKFLHTITSGYLLAAIFVVGISAWFLLKKREEQFAMKSIIVASVFGILAAVYTIFSGDESARVVAKHQPMKFASMEALYDGQQNAPLVAIGFFGSSSAERPNEQEFAFKFEIPNMLSYLAFLDANAFVPGIRDLVHGNEKRGIISYKEKIAKGKKAIDALGAYKIAKKAKSEQEAKDALKIFKENFEYFGYGYYFNKDPHMLLPNVKISFYAFHTMVILGGFFLVLLMYIYFLARNNKLQDKRWLLWIALWTIPLVYLAQQAGWVVAEVGRQPWVIQDLMPNIAAVSQIDTYSVQITFFLFLLVFTALLIAEIKIMLTTVRKGPEITENSTKK